MSDQVVLAFADAFLTEVQEQIQPGTSALFLLVAWATAGRAPRPSPDPTPGPPRLTHQARHGVPTLALL
jgi:hypothetical protein